MNDPVPIPSWEEGNPLYPLPKDYFSSKYIREDRRLLRINGLRQWLLWDSKTARSPAERRLFRHRRAEALVACIRFFDSYYLNRDIDESGEEFDPLFYDFDPVSSPEYHWTITRASVFYRRVIAGGPRGSAKTRYLMKRIGTQGISRPGYSHMYMTSMNDLSEELGDNMKTLFSTNARIHDDWAPEYGGSILPKRGAARQGMANFTLTNRYNLFCTSVESRKRGKRPAEVYVDDAEYDARNPSQTNNLTDWMDYMMRRVIMPMLRRPGTRVLILGTLISPRSWLWIGLQTRELEIDGTTYRVAVNPWFDKWFRIIQPAAIERYNEDGTPFINPFTITPANPVGTNLHSCWPEMWPINAAEKEALNLHEETETLEEIEAEDPPAFQAEMMCRPDLGVGADFPLLTEELHGYALSSIDALYDTAPYLSLTNITFSRLMPTDERVWHTTTIRDLIAAFPTFILCDTSDTANASSDFKTAITCCLTDHNELIVLDAWQKQCELDEQALQALLMSERWRVFLIAPEAIRSGLGLIDRLNGLLSVNMHQNLGVSHTPAVEGFNPGPLPKTAKISAMKVRFQHGLVKLPLWHRYPQHRTAVWCALFEQIECYRNRGGDDTSLPKDDLIDTLAMHRFVIAGLPTAPIDTTAAREHRSIEELLREGRTDLFRFVPRAVIHQIISERDAVLLQSSRSPPSVEI